MLCFSTRIHDNNSSIKALEFYPPSIFDGSSEEKAVDKYTQE